MLALLLLILLAAVDLPSPEPSQQQLARGRQIYVEGTSPTGAEITAVMDGEVEVPASAVPCASCHGRDGKGRPEGGVTPSDLTWAALTKPYGVRHPSGREHPAYDPRLLKRAIAMGLDPAGNKLNAAMPRFRMSLRDMEDLAAYVQQLGTGTDPGMSETALRIGVVLPPAPPAGTLSRLSQAVRAALTARFDQVNRQGGIYGRRIEPRFLEAPAAADQRKAWTADFLEREQVFASVASFLAGADAELAGLFQEKEIPLIGPFTLFPRETFPVNRYVFYLLPGIEAQGQALVRFARSRWEGNLRAAIVAPENRELDSAVESIQKAMAAAGWPMPLTSRGSRREDLQRLADAGSDPVVFLGAGPELRVLLREADRIGWHPRVLATATAADDSLFSVPAAFDGKVFVALPTSPGGLAPEAEDSYRSLASTAKLPADDLSAQFSAIAAADLLIEALQRAGRDLSRERLVEQLEQIRAFSKGFAPPLTYGPSRRLGARGAYVTRVDLHAKRLVPEGGWVEVQ